MTEKNGFDLKRSTHRKMQNDRKKEVVLAQSGSSNVAVKNELNTKCCESSSNTKIQNIAKACSVQEQGDGFSNDRKQVKDKFGYAAGDGFPND